MLVAGLIWPRAGIAERVAVKPLELDGGSADLSAAGWTERILFKETVDGRFGVHVAVTEQLTEEETGSFLRHLGSLLVKVAGVGLGATVEGSAGTGLVKAPFTAAARMVSRSEQLLKRMVGEGDVTAEADHADLDNARLEVPLKAPGRISRTVRSRAHGRVRTRRRTLLEAGADNGIAVMTARLLTVLILATSLGCAPDVARLDRRDQGAPLVRKAMARQAEGDVEAAVRLYTRALNADPGLARAHLDLALLLHDDVKDYIGAICHYRRYLQLRPETEKRDMIERRMQRAGHLHAGKVLRVDRDAAREAAKLKLENEKLSRDVTRLQEEIASLRETLEETRKAAEPEPTASRPPEPAPKEEPADRAVVRTYRVQKGDTLSSIAGQMYRDPSRWQRILEANKETLDGSHRLSVGQVLVIP